MRVMKKYIMFLMCLMALSCTDNLTEVEIVEFGARVYDDYQMPLSYRPGEFKIEIVSDGEFVATIEEGEEWMRFENGETSYTGSREDEFLVVSVDANRTIMRSGKIVLNRLHRTVEIEVSQVGILSEDFSIEHQNLSIGAEGGSLSAKVLTLAGPDDIIIEPVNMELTEEQEKELEAALEG